jgi:hypothetical protein
MKLINTTVGLIITVFILALAYVWVFAPEKKQEIQDWWYSTTIDCQQMYIQVSNHQRCERRDDCELTRKESIRAEKLAAQYGRYCGKL